MKSKTTVHLSQTDIQQTDAGWQHLNAGPDDIVLYTDSITEAENPAGEIYGLKRLCQVVSWHWQALADAVQQAVIADMAGFISTQKV